MRIFCPFHDDGDTPNMEIYSDGYKCFSVRCGKHGPLSDLKGVTPPTGPKFVTDIKAELARIESLPMKEHRGFTLPDDGTGFYIIWPDRTYFKKRMTDPSSPQNQKYRNPSGTKQPLFFINRHSSVLAIVEGELNAMSVARAVKWDVASPGSAGEFKNPNLITDKFCGKYRRVYAIADNDGAGGIALLQLMQRLKRPVKAILMSPDANEVLCRSGESELAKVLYEKTGERD